MAASSMVRTARLLAHEEAVPQRTARLLTLAEGAPQRAARFFEGEEDAPQRAAWLTMMREPLVGERDIVYFL